VADLELIFAGLDYLDRTRALLDGSLRPEGIELECRTFGPYELFQRVAQKVEFDVAEMSASTYISLVSQGDRRYVAIPVFLSRLFRHGYMFVHGESRIREPADLAGCRVGVPDYEMTAAVWQRAVLMHDYGVAPEQIQWFQGGEFQPGFVRRVELPSRPGLSIEVIPEDRTLHDMVATGEIDAVLCPHTPASLRDGSGRVRRLFPDYVEVEQDYYRRTGIFPIMHLMVLRRELYEEHPWVAASLTRAFAQAQALGWKRLGELGALAVMLPWLGRHLEEISDLMGPDHWRYGFRENEVVLRALCRYSHEQGLSARELTPEEIFAPETHDLQL
jgi:4,5-dihydroxyphthalate decarboxylase